jgi:hypothetical protein
MKHISIFGLIVLLATGLLAQGSRKQNLHIGFSGGAGFSNLLFSEAPHKINIFGSDKMPVLVNDQDITKALAYTDYPTSLFSDVLTALTARVHLEYFLKKNLSVQTGLSYERKGIDLLYSSISSHSFLETAQLEVIYRNKIINDYLIIPLLVKMYFPRSRNLFAVAGVYTGYLLSSRIDFLNQKKITDKSRIVSDYSFYIDNEKDSEKEYTHLFDFGVSLGAGYVVQLSKKLKLRPEIMVNAGLRKVDAKYNNEYSAIPVANLSGYNNLMVRSTNYYGLNSQAKNINVLFTLGVDYKLGRIN